ncbi:MAG: hypothetical protein HY978_01005 [Candidatus Liptonbacteria bacterium]|nr:hypothetical protein [Candidatus Liptonbacteria bacterium]
MTEIVPSINCAPGELSCVTNKVRAAERFTTWVHLDIADGIFTHHRSWNEPGRWRDLETDLNLEVHLMVAEAGKEIGKWLWAGARRVIVHVETMVNPEQDAMKLLATCASHGAELVLSSNPETPAAKLLPFLSKFSAFHCLAVHPGPSGQSFLPLVLEKVKWLRQEAPDKSIEVDGGLGPTTTRRVIDAGADRLVFGAYIWNRPDPAVAYKELQIAVDM